MDIPELLPVEKSNNIQVNNVKTNIIKMLSDRGFIEPQNVDGYIKMLTDNDEDTDMEFQINLDNDTNYNTHIPNKVVYVKFFDQKIISVSKNSPIGNFITKYFNDYKIIIVDNINPKTEQTINNYKTQTEIFKFKSLVNRVITHHLVPKHEVLTDEEKINFQNEFNVEDKDLPLIYSSDAVAKYYNVKQGNVCKITRMSKVSGEAIFYRICVNK